MENGAPVSRTVGANLRFAWNNKEYLHCLLDGMLVFWRVSPNIKFAGSYLIYIPRYTRMNDPVQRLTPDHPDSGMNEKKL